VTAGKFFEFRTANDAVNGRSMAALAGFLPSAHHAPLASFAGLGRSTNWSPSLLTPMERRKTASSMVRSRTEFVILAQRQQSRWLVAESKISTDISLLHAGQIVIVGIVQTIQASAVFVKAERLPSCLIASRLPAKTRRTLVDKVFCGA
jgi:hypothetical protein